MPTYLVVYDAAGNPFEDELVARFRKFKHSRQVFDNAWIIKTPKKIAELRTDIMDYFHTDEDRWFIVEILRFTGDLNPDNNRWLQAL